MGNTNLNTVNITHDHNCDNQATVYPPAAQATALPTATAGVKGNHMAAELPVVHAQASLPSHDSSTNSIASS